MMRTRHLLLGLAFVSISAAVAWKLNQRYLPADDRPLQNLRSAPRFACYDHSKPQRLIRLETYLGRHRILLAFFDGQQPVTADPTIQLLKTHFKRLNNQDIVVLAISPAVPYQNRKAWEAAFGKGSEPPFPLLSDPGFSVHRQWGRLVDHVSRNPARINNAPRDGQTQVQPLRLPEFRRPALFLIDRLGRVPFQSDRPVPVPDAEVTILELAGLGQAKQISGSQ